jgi:DNA-binding transcriptional LysR family regulator
MDRLDEWRLFVAVAQARGFAKAARTQRRSPQAATRAIAALETRLATRLFHRTTRSVTLTPEGERLLAQARHALAEMDALERANDTVELRGTLTVTAPVMFGQLHVRPIVTELLGLHANLDARLLLHDRVVSLAEEGIDVAIRIGELPDSSLRARLVGNVHAMYVASPTYWARRRTMHDGIAFLPSAGDDETKMRIRLTTSSPHAAIDAARDGLGIVRVLSYQAASAIADGSLIPVLKGRNSEPIPVHLVQLPGLTSRAATAFVDLAYERLKGAISLKPVLFRRS